MGKIFLLILISCISLIAQECKLIEDGDSGKKMLVGRASREAFQDSNFAWWFNYEYENYNVDTNILIEKKSLIIDIKIIIVLGTWCSDSKREVPRFLKVIDFIDFPKDSLEIINVDRNKEGLENEVDGLDIELVPTIIVFEKGEEIGRIVEAPVESLEKDLVEIVTKN